MPLFSTSVIRAALQPNVVDEHHGEAVDTTGSHLPENRKASVSASTKETNLSETVRAASPSSAASSDDGKQAGVAQAEAITSVWSKQALVWAYVGIFIVFFVNSFQQIMSSNLLLYVTSDFSAAPLVTVTTVVSSICSAAAKLPIGKMIDVWGRAEGFLVMVAISTIGLIMMAATNGVQLYAAAQVFYWVGFTGQSYVLDVFLADTSQLKNRGWLFAFSTCPYIVTAFAGPAGAQAFYNPLNPSNPGPGWRWMYGAFAVITPVITAPISIIFLVNQRKAKQLGHLRRAPSGRTFLQSCKHYFIECDIFGMLLLIAAFSLFLLPFSLAKGAKGGWSNPSMIAMLVVGIVLFPAFALYERFVAAKPFAPFHLLTDRTVLGACLLGATLFVSFYCWDTYFSPWLQVVAGLSLADAGYMLNIYNIGSCFFSLFFGFAIRASGNFKYLALALVPLQLLGTGLMIYFRQPGVHIGYVVMCQIFIAFSGGGLVISEEIAIMAAASHSEVATVLALLGLFTSIGGAIGQTISGAIYTNTFLPYLEDALPAETKPLASTIYLSAVTQLTYPVGSPTRDAIVAAYTHTQRYLLIAATAVLPLAIVFVLLWRNIDVRKVRQVKGTVV